MQGRIRGVKGWRCVICEPALYARAVYYTRHQEIRRRRRLDAFPPPA